MAGKLLFHNSIYSNVILHVGSTQLHLHKEILEHESEFFASLLGDRWCHKKDTETLELNIEARNDLELYVAAIELMYTHQLPTSVKHDVCQALEMLRICYELLFSEGIKLCINAILESIQKTPANLGVVIQFNNRFGFKELQQVCDREAKRETISGDLRELLKMALEGNSVSQRVLQEVIDEDANCLDSVFRDDENLLTQFVAYTFQQRVLPWFAQQVAKTNTRFQAFIILNTLQMERISFATQQAKRFTASLFCLLPKVLEEGKVRPCDVHAFCARWFPLAPESISDDQFKQTVEGIMQFLDASDKFAFITQVAKSGREIAAESLAAEAKRVFRQLKGSEDTECMQLADDNCVE